MQSTESPKANLKDGLKSTSLCYNKIMDELNKNTRLQKYSYSLVGGKAASNTKQS